MIHDFQFFTDGRVHLRTKDQDSMWRLVAEYLRNRISSSPLDPPHDFVIERDEVQLLLRQVENALKTARDELPPTEAPRKHLVYRDVLGLKIGLNPRISSHVHFKDLSDLYLTLAKAMDAGKDLQILVLPSLTSLQFRLAWLLKNTPGGLRNSEVLDALTQEYVRLMEHASTTGELKGKYQREMDTLGDDEIREATTFLKKWGLLRNGEDGSRILPTPKLFAVQL